MSSRLDRLFILLESGTSQVTRKLAAKQLGEVQSLHPHELHNLLKRTLILLRNTNWDTRIAAAQAIESILNSLPKWDPPGQLIKNEDRYMSETNKLKLDKFDLEKILCAAPLSGSEGKEFDCEDDNNIDINERIARQRQQLNLRLGFGDNGILSSINNLGNLVTNDDLKPLTVSNRTQLNRKPIDDMVSSVLSSREINRARRKARQSAFSRSVSNGSQKSQQEDEEEPEKKKVKIELDENSCEGYGTPDGSGNWSDTIEWPLEGLCERLWLELFSPRWESRHGAATALREVLKAAGDGAGKNADTTKDQMEEQHHTWLEDAAVRLLWILALDRFGDFVSDQVVAPVRETCAQALGLIIKEMNPTDVHRVLNLLIQMLSRKEWETRHGGLLGIKYMLAARQDLVSELLPVIFPHIQNGVSDSMDDVGAVAASCLIPIANKLMMVQSELCPLVTKLWDLLLDQDELASACNSFMGLLAAILSLPDASELLKTQPLTEFVPRLWPFLAHNSSSVRCATLQTLFTLSQESVNFIWPSSLLQEALRHIFQRVLIEHIPEIQDLVKKVWSNLIDNSPLDTLLHAACPFFATWLCMTMHPARVPFDPAMLIHAISLKKSKLGGSESAYFTDLQKYFVGGRETTPQNIREQNVIRARCIASQMLGQLSQYLVKPAPGVEYPPDTNFPLDTFIRVMLPYLQSHSALQKLVASLVLANWAGRDESSKPCHPLLAETLHAAMNQTVYYDEIAVTCTRLLQETRDFLATLKHYKIDLGIDNRDVIPLEKISEFSGPATQQLLVKCKLKQKVFESLEERRKNIHASVTQTTSDQLMLNVSTMAAIAGAATQLNCLPVKLNPLIKPLMESLKRETLEPLQQLSADHLAILTSLCLERNPCPNPKIIMNLCSFVKADSEFTPKIGLEKEVIKSSQTHEMSEERMIMSLGKTAYDGILTLTNQQRAIEKAAFKKNNSGTGRGPGRPPATDIPIEELLPVEDEVTLQNRIQRRGGTFALKAITRHFGPDLPMKMPKLWETIHDGFQNIPNIESFDKSAFDNNKTAAEDLISSLQILEIVCSSLHNSLLPKIFIDILPKFCMLLSHPFKAVRHMTARAIAALADIDVLPVMEAIVEKVIPMLGTIDCHMKRQGASELIACVVEILQVKIVPFVALLIVPLLGRMSDHDQSVRLMTTHSFAHLIQLFPLEGRSTKDLPGASKNLNHKCKQHREFLEHLFHPKDIPEYKIPVAIKAELRSYQQAGVNWLAFLNKYRLHGVLCDDMGLGKTLQSICMLAGDNHAREQMYKATGAPDCAPLPNLVICPPTLTGHWVYEVKKFLPSNSLRPLQYAGPPVEREALRPKFKHYNLIVASYDIVRKDISFFSSIKWNYCILDEGHIIKNGKTKASKAVKQLIANHRLILSGTPIQNNVLELWSLFDFLMPGFLGTERQFNAKYSRPILASRDPKSSSKEQEAGALAMESLHRQVLPFLLRRMKQDVLKDLPPKITQDYYCDLSPLQELLYEDFAKSHLAHSLQGSGEDSAPGNSPHVFQALRYLQNVCNHPKLVLVPGHPQYEKVVKDMVNQKSSLDDINHSAKLPALKQLLLDCGIGHSLTAPIMESCVNQHRALVFCQLKAVLDIIEKDLFKVHMPELTYLRLDGSIAPSQRHEVVTRFNNDPSIDVLLLTTQVGGLGLNLTGADTVIFVEHDWNPMRDLQAMDRAHRIGQKKVVNVYRLITRATLEERIMGLQKFKLLTANTVISGENGAMESMGTDQILDLFSLSTKKSNDIDSNEDLISKDGNVLTAKSVLKALPDLWQEKEYTEEYDLTNYVNSLNRKQ